MTISIKNILAGAALGTTLAANAAPVLVTASGVAGQPFSGSSMYLEAGDTVNFKFIYDNAQSGPDINPSNSVGNFGGVTYSEISFNNTVLTSDLGRIIQTNTNAAGTASSWRITSPLTATGLPQGVFSAQWFAQLVDNINSSGAIYGANPAANTYVEDIASLKGGFNVAGGSISLAETGGNVTFPVTLALNNFSFSEIKEPPTNDVPEPASGALVLAALAAAAAARRRNGPV